MLITMDKIKNKQLILLLAKKRNKWIIQKNKNQIFNQNNFNLKLETHKFKPNITNNIPANHYQKQFWEKLKTY